MEVALKLILEELQNINSKNGHIIKFIIRFKRYFDSNKSFHSRTK